MSKTYKKVQVWIGSEPNQVLLFKVIEKRGGGWHPVTGSVEKEDSSLLVAAKRETQEETGIDAEVGEWKDLDYFFEFTGQWGHASEHAFGLFLPQKPKKIHLDPGEHSECEWVSAEEALNRLSFPDQKRALKKFLCYLK